MNTVCKSVFSEYFRAKNPQNKQYRVNSVAKHFKHSSLKNQLHLTDRYDAPQISFLAVIALSINIIDTPAIAD